MKLLIAIIMVKLFATFNYLKMNNIAKYIIFFGLIITSLGIIVYFFNGYLGWVGKTPLDFSYQNNNVKIYFPLGTMLIISILLTFIINMFR